MSHTVFAPIIRLEKLQVPRLFVGLPSSYRRRFWNAAYEVPMKAQHHQCYTYDCADGGRLSNVGLRTGHVV
jgi:hypothetical protein